MLLVVSFGSDVDLPPDRYLLRNLLIRKAHGIRDVPSLERAVAAQWSADDIRTVVLSLPRTEEALVRDQVKFRVGRIVYLALSRDELSMGFGFPKDERAALVAAHPEKFFMPIQSDLRYNWVRVWLDTIDKTEMQELVVDAWRMVVPKRVAAEHLGDHP
jgi:hypothetical protein